MLTAVDLPRRQRAFTLLEICIVIFLILLLLTVAMPSLSGLLSRQRLQATFDRFDALATAAQKHSVGENRPYTLVWMRDGSVRLYPADLTTEERRKRDPASVLVPAGPTTSRNEHYFLVRDAALATKPAEIWTFWPTGNCEPVAVRYEGPAGKWEANYNPLTAKGNLSSFIAR